LVEAANAASRKKGSYLKAKFFRLNVRRGHKRAILALGHKILVAAYHVLAKATDYVDLG
jgi:transposase